MPVPDKRSIYNMENGDMRIPDQRTKIWRTDWKYLIILDACRYDYFEKVYREFLQGRLEKVYSCGSTTQEWLEKVFGGMKWDDIVYISANPYVNSKGITILGYETRKWCNFYKIIDVWDWGWDEEYETVPPWNVNKAVLVARKMYRNKKFIIHYIQPHQPYLTLAAKGIKIGKLKQTERGHRSFIERIKGFIRWKIAYLIGGERAIGIVNKLIGPSPSYMAYVAKRFSINGLD